MKKLSKRFLALVLLLSIFTSSWAQQQKITGKVLDEKGAPIPNVSIIVNGTNLGTTTNNMGEFSINAPKSSKSLVFTCLNYERQVIPIAGNILNVSMSLSKGKLDEVIVIGYGTQKVANVSGAISTIKTADIEKASPVRVEEAIQGRASGVTVIQSGSPGVKPTLFVRGIPSFSGSDPLVVVDGSIQTLDDFNSINPADVESINILKDAASTAIYGVSGGNGVIVVTTKNGKKNQKTQFGVSSSYGNQQLAKEIGVLNATEYAAILNEGSTTSGGPVLFPNLSAMGVGTNWQDQVFQSAPIQSHAISASGGSEKTTYFLSAGFTDQVGILGGTTFSKSDYQRGNFTANLNFQLAPKLKFIVNATEVLLSSKGVQEGNWNGIIGEALNFDPTVPVYNKVPNTIGTYGFSNLILQEVHNPLTEMQNTYNKNIGNKQYGKFELQYDVLKNLKLTSRFGYTNYIDNVKSFSPLIFYGLNNIDNSLNADGTTVSGRHNSVSSTRNNYFNFNWESFANYDFKIKEDHHIETVIGVALGKNAQNHLGASKQDVPFNSWTFASIQSATGVNTAANTQANSGYYWESFTKSLSYFARANYDFQSKYLASFSVRRDGSSEFTDAKKFGNFYAGSLGWVVSRENFFHSNLIDFLKLRASYGSVGSSNGASLQSTSIITGGTYNNIGNSNGYYFNGVFYPGSSVGSQLNPNQLGWETDAQFNGGFEITLLKNKISLTADYYQKNVSNLLFTGTQALFVGTVPAPLANIGSTRTTGLDAMISLNETLGSNFKLHTSLTFTSSNSLVTATNFDNSAKITGGAYFNGQSQTVTVFQKGQAPGYFYGYKTNGLFQSADQISKSPIQNGAQPGDIKYMDLNGDGVIDSRDQTKIGNPFPKFVMGWNLGLDYKNFDFTAFIYASYGNNIYRAYERNSNYTNKFRSILARWTGPGTTNDARYPRYSFTDPNDNARVSDRYVEDGSFIKIKNLQLGYTFPQSLANNLFTRLRVYISIKNAYTFTKYSGFDPEISGGILGSGVDLGTYPQARVYTFGLDLKF
ncbi:MAG: TonB-dependent receptor [Bacteroidetes bacterium]|nr:TonB-dependent receptor [Bacteroidota bacterium]